MAVGVRVGVGESVGVGLLVGVGELVFVGVSVWVGVSVRVGVSVNAAMVEILPARPARREVRNCSTTASWVVESLRNGQMALKKGIISGWL